MLELRADVNEPYRGAFQQLCRIAVPFAELSIQIGCTEDRGAPGISQF